MVKKGVFVKFTGRVQGVGFRMLVVNKASAFGVKGWIRNCDKFDSVEAVFVGEKDKIDSLIFELKKSSGFVRIDKVIVEPFASDEKFTSFGVRY